MKKTNKYTDYLFEIMQDHYENNKSIYSDESKEWQKTNRMNNKIMKIIKDYFIKQQWKEKKDDDIQYKIRNTRHRPI